MRYYSSQEREESDIEAKHSKEKLLNDTIKKIKTTMIGAIASMEKFFDDYLDDPEFEQLFEEMREEILDKGNNQIRILKNELRQYSVVWNKYEYKFNTRK